jgi:hypothetical protein
MAVVISLLVPVAVADDFAAPLWRQEPTAMTAEWELMADPGVGVGLPPDGLDGITNLAPGGGVDTWAAYLEGIVAQPGDGDGQWLAEIDSSIIIQMDDVIDLMPEKFVHIQMTFNGPQDVTPWVFGVYPEGDLGVSGELLTFDAVSDNHRSELWRLTPNPTYEVIGITVPAGVAVDQIVIDTVSIPEPATIFIFGGLGLAVLMKKRG